VETPRLAQYLTITTLCVILVPWCPFVSHLDGMVSHLVSVSTDNGPDQVVQSRSLLW